MLLFFMTIQAIWEQLCVNVRSTTWQEWGSTGMQIASVWYAKKNNLLVYPTGIIGVLLAAWLYYFVARPPLYADAILNLYYFIMSIYGWRTWLQKKNNAYVFPISWCNKQEWQWGILLFLCSWWMIWWMLVKLTNSNTPLLDSLVSSTAVTAMWWMAKRKMENWLAWIVSNVVAIPLNFYKGFVLFTLMYVLFLILAIAGYKEWKEKI